MDQIGLDFETYGAVSLPKHGLYRYVQDATFKVLLASIAVSPTEATTLDFVAEPTSSIRHLKNLIGDSLICAHNAPFEQVVLRRLGLDYPSARFIDSAVVARVAGGGGSLEAAAPQLLDSLKLETGKSLIRFFAIPSKQALLDERLYFDAMIVHDNPAEWLEFIKYCEMDAMLSLELVERHGFRLSPVELDYQAVTMDMNQAGWRVDLDLVLEMQRRYQANLAKELESFRLDCDADELNLNSLKQLKEWCNARGVKATSFAEKPVERLRNRLLNKLDSTPTTDAKYIGYTEVLALLTAKQVLGGSSLKKLQVIIDTVQFDSKNYRLNDQYIHCGASQSLRTTGRSVQMQNLKRLAVVQDMSDLWDRDSEWDNDMLAENLRQVFTASEPGGRLIVGDFSSVESRGLAWLSDEDWKVDAYRRNEDLYKVLASMIYGVPYDQVNKEQRQTGKVGELSCGYGAGPGAVVAFAEGMGVKLEESEAASLVWNWREANPAIVKMWERLNQMLHKALTLQVVEDCGLQDHLRLEIGPCATPISLQKQHPGGSSIKMVIVNARNEIVLCRYFHGCYIRGRNVCYYKASERKTGDLWTPSFIDPKTKQRRFYELYGGKLAGILTQSFCRELFFESLLTVHKWATPLTRVKLVGQFHDEIVLDWSPGTLDIEHCKRTLRIMMSSSNMAPSFPLAADIKDDYRYTK